MKSSHNGWSCISEDKISCDIAQHTCMLLFKIINHQVKYILKGEGLSIFDNNEKLADTTEILASKYYLVPRKTIKRS